MLQRAFIELIWRPCSKFLTPNCRFFTSSFKFIKSDPLCFVIVFVLSCFLPGFGAFYTYWMTSEATSYAYERLEPWLIKYPEMREPIKKVLNDGVMSQYEYERLENLSTQAYLRKEKEHIKSIQTKLEPLLNENEVPK